MSRNLRLYYLFRALSCAHVFKPFTYFYCISRGLSVFEFMLLFTIFSLSVILFEIPTGAWADRLGRRRSMAVGAMLMGAASLGYLAAYSFAAFAVCELVFALGLTLTSGADSAFLFDTLKDAGRSKDYLVLEGKAGFSKHLGLTLAALAGGIMASIDLRLPYIVTALVSIIAAAVALKMSENGYSYRMPALRERSGEKGQALENPASMKVLKQYAVEGARTISRTPPLGWAIVYSSILFVVIRMSDALYQPVLKRQGFGFLAVGGIFAGLNLMAALSSRQVGTVRRVVTEKGLLWGLPAAIILSYLLLDAWGPFLCVLLMLVQYTVTGIYSPLTKNLINHRIGPSHLRATVLSAESASKRLLVALVSPVIGLVISYFSLRAGLYACAGVALLGMGTALMVLRRRRRSEGPTLAPSPSGPVPSPALSMEQRAGSTMPAGSGIVARTGFAARGGLGGGVPPFGSST